MRKLLTGASARMGTRPRSRARCRRRRGAPPAPWDRALGEEYQQQHPHDDRGVGEVEGRPAEGELDEIGHRSRAQTVHDVSHRSPDQHPGGQPDERPLGVARKVDEQREHRNPDRDRDEDLVAGEEAEGDAVVACIDELHPRQEPLFFAGSDRAAHEVLGELVEDQHHRHDRSGAGPRQQSAARGVPRRVAISRGSRPGPRGC